MYLYNKTYIYHTEQLYIYIYTYVYKYICVQSAHQCGILETYILHPSACILVSGTVSLNLPHEHPSACGTVSLNLRRVYSSTMWVRSCESKNSAVGSVASGPLASDL